MIYNTSIEQELGRNEKYIKSKAIRDSLRVFAMDLKVQDGLTDHRVMFYLIRLRVLSRIETETEFLNPTVESLKTAIMKQSAKPNISPRTVEDYKQAMRKYYSWKLSPAEFQAKVAWIHVKGNTVNRLKKSDDMITKDEFNKLIGACLSSRDKALFSTLYDSGCRVGEILTLRIRDLQNDQWGTVLHVTGKTGERMVRIVGDSVPYLREWISKHPKANDPNSMVFVSVSGDKYGEPMNYDEMLRALGRAKRRAGITRRIHPHLFRHTRASILASRVAEAPLESQMGWIHGSRQTRTYVHLSARDQDSAILKAYGIKIEETDNVKEDSPRSCPRCDTLNPSNSKFCRKCWLPFDVKTALEHEAKEKEIQEALTVSPDVDPVVRSVIENMPEETKLKLLESVLKGLQQQKTLK
jgi:integrase/recombinase XerD